MTKLTVQRKQNISPCTKRLYTSYKDITIKHYYMRVKISQLHTWIGILQNNKSKGRVASIARTTCSRASVLSNRLQDQLFHKRAPSSLRKESCSYCSIDGPNLSSLLAGHRFVISNTQCPLSQIFISLRGILLIASFFQSVLVTSGLNASV